MKLAKKIYIIPDGVIGRECQTCKVFREFSFYRKGNAKYGYKSECKFCQIDRRREYRKKPGIRERETRQNREARNKLPKYEKTLRYLKRKDYVDNWIANNPDKYRAGEKSKSHSRKKRSAELIKLETSSIVALEHYNMVTFTKSNFVCEYCNIEIVGQAYHLDHILAIKNKGNNNLENLAITCRHCNCSKSSKLLSEWMPEKVDYVLNRKIL
jgi:5-methylcytosine-specific restriction endonuclease McrA